MLEQFPGKVRLVYKSFPLTSIHPQAFKAAVAAMAAQRQGKFWPFHDKLFAGGAPPSDSRLREVAKAVGLDLPLFEKGLTDPELTATVERDLREGMEIGVRSTPSLFINGRQTGYRGPDELVAAVKAALGKAGK